MEDWDSGVVRSVRGVWWRGGGEGYYYSRRVYGSQIREFDELGSIEYGHVMDVGWGFYC